MSVLYPGQRVQITDPGVYVQYAGMFVTLVSRIICESDEGDYGYPVWSVSPVLDDNGVEIFWSEPSFTPLDGDELVAGEAPPLDLVFPTRDMEAV